MVDNTWTAPSFSFWSYSSALLPLSQIFLHSFFIFFFCLHPFLFFSFFFFQCLLFLRLFIFIFLVSALLSHLFFPVLLLFDFYTLFFPGYCFLYSHRNHSVFSHFSLLFLHCILLQKTVYSIYFKLYYSFSPRLLTTFNSKNWKVWWEKR